MQVYVPLNTPAAYDDTKPLAHALAKMLEKGNPKLVVSVMKKAERGGKVFIDWSQNDRHKTTVAPYSLRARERPTVSTPLDWDEVEAVADGDDPDTLVFEAGDLLERVEDRGDLFAPVVEKRQKLPELTSTE
jgi:bifunctional non-homologous end joining protein LigD